MHKALIVKQQSVSRCALADAICAVVRSNQVRWPVISASAGPPQQLAHRLTFLELCHKQDQGRQKCNRTVESPECQAKMPRMHKLATCVLLNGSGC